MLALAVSLFIGSTACARDVTGTARPDPARPPVAIAEDGYGVKIGFDDAPVQLEIYTEPQCNHCADLQADFGDQMLGYIGLGQLAITYRPMTFLDKTGNQHSERVANAMFVAATPGGGDTTADGMAFQRLVEEMWSHYDGGIDSPSNDELAEMARIAGIPDEQAAKIADGDSAVDVKEMEDANFGLLYEADPIETGTPTVLEAKSGEKLDVFDNDWLSKLMAS